MSSDELDCGINATGICSSSVVPMGLWGRWGGKLIGEPGRFVERICPVWLPEPTDTDAFTDNPGVFCDNDPVGTNLEGEVPECEVLGRNDENVRA
jgi:hypothetical protein